MAEFWRHVATLQGVGANPAQLEHPIIANGYLYQMGCSITNNAAWAGVSLDGNSTFIAGTIPAAESRRGAYFTTHGNGASGIGYSQIGGRRYDPNTVNADPADMTWFVNRRVPVASGNQITTGASISSGQYRGVNIAGCYSAETNQIYVLLGDWDGSSTSTPRIDALTSIDPISRVVTNLGLPPRYSIDSANECAVVATGGTVYVFLNRSGSIYVCSMGETTKVWSTWTQLSYPVVAGSSYGSPIFAAPMADGRIILVRSFDYSSAPSATYTPTTTPTFYFSPQTLTLSAGPILPCGVYSPSGGFCTDIDRSVMAFYGTGVHASDKLGTITTGRIYILDGLPRTIRGNGDATVSLIAIGQGTAAVRHYATGAATITLAAVGRGYALERAFHFPRQRVIAPARVESAANRTTTHLYLSRFTGLLTPRKDPKATGEKMWVRLVTAFNAARQHNGRARLKMRLNIWGREGSQAWVDFGFELENTGLLHTHIQSSTMLVRLDMTVNSVLTYQIGEAVLPVKLRIAGHHGLGFPDAEILPPGETRLRTNLWLWPPPDGHVIAEGKAEIMPVDMGMETEHRPYTWAEPQSMQIDLLAGRGVRYWDWTTHSYQWFRAPQWDGNVYPAAQLAVGFIRFELIGQGVQTQYGEVSVERDSIDLDMAASYYPWGRAVLNFVEDLWAKGRATYYGRWKPLVRMDYINFTGKVTAYGKLKAPLSIGLFTRFGGLENAILGRAARQHIRLTLNPRGAYVIRVIHPRPVKILDAVMEPFHIHHAARSEGI